MAAKRKCSESELIKNAFFANCNSRPSDFPFQNLSISVLDLNNFRLTSKTGPFLPVFSHFHTKSMLVYGCFIVMWLFSSILVPVELFFKGMCSQEVLSQTPNSASVSYENGK